MLALGRMYTLCLRGFVCCIHCAPGSLRTDFRSTACAHAEERTPSFS